MPRPLVTSGAPIHDYLSAVIKPKCSLVIRILVQRYDRRLHRCETEAFNPIEHENREENLLDDPYYGDLCYGDTRAAMDCQ